MKQLFQGLWLVFWTVVSAALALGGWEMAEIAFAVMAYGAALATGLYLIHRGLKSRHP